MRRRFAVAVGVFLAPLPMSPALAQSDADIRIDRGPSLPIKVQLDAISTGQLVVLLMRDVMRVPYVIAPDVLTDAKPTSVNLTIPRDDVPMTVVRFLRGIGLQVELAGGTVYVSRRGFGGSSSGVSLPGQIQPGASPRSAPGQTLPGTFGRAPQPESYVPPVVDPVGRPATDVLAVVRPAHRPAGEFVETIRLLLPDVRVSGGGDRGQPNGLDAPNAPSNDTIIIGGASDQVAQAVAVIEAIDKPRPSVVVTALLMEVSASKSRGSALNILTTALSPKVGVSSFPSEAPGPQAISLAVGGIRAVLSAVRDDNRFSIVAEPSVTVQSGSVATINAGSDVPTLGAVTFGENGLPIRSVEYRQSGLTLTVAPQVVGSAISLSLTQERSSFARTNTGVDDSPTLNQTSISSRFDLAPGETVALASLEESSASRNRAGIFGGLLGTRSNSSSEAQLLLLLQADLRDPATTGQTWVAYIGDDNGEKKDADGPVRPLPSPDRPGANLEEEKPKLVPPRHGRASIL